jgi:hypothetical protein
LNGAGGAARGYLVNRVFAEMYNLRAIAGRLVQLPVDESASSGNLAGPPFEMAYTYKLPPSESDRWRLHRDLHEASVLCLGDVEAELGRRSVSAGDGRQYLTALIESDGRTIDQIDTWLASSKTPSAVSTHP